MTSSQTAVVEQDAWLDGPITTEPFEAGWASEAIWFIVVLDTSGAEWIASPEISPDGSNWVTTPLSASLRFATVGVHALPLEHFGVWLRLNLEPNDASARCKVRIVLTLK